METILLLLISIVPVIGLAYYIYDKDYEKESSSLLFKLIMGGILVVIPAASIESLAGNLFPDSYNMTTIQFLVYILIDIAFVEEVFKWFMVYIFSYNSREFDYMYDAVVYSSFVSLGFASVENLLYVIHSTIHVGLMRAIISVPAHASFGILMGIFIAYAKKFDIKRKHEKSALCLISSIFIPSLAHGIYDYCLYMNSKTYLTFFIIFVSVLFVISFIMLRKMAKERREIYNTRTLTISDLHKK